MTMPTFTSIEATEAEGGTVIPITRAMQRAFRPAQTQAGTVAATYARRDLEPVEVNGLWLAILAHGQATHEVAKLGEFGLSVHVMFPDTSRLRIDCCDGKVQVR